MNALMLLLFLYFIQIVVESHHIAFRNSFLRIIITNDYKKTRNTFKQIKRFLYNRTISTYYDISQKYYALSEDDKTLIEAIISLGY